MFQLGKVHDGHTVAYDPFLCIPKGQGFFQKLLKKDL